MKRRKFFGLVASAFAFLVPGRNKASASSPILDEEMIRQDERERMIAMLYRKMDYHSRIQPDAWHGHPNDAYREGRTSGICTSIHEIEMVEIGKRIVNTMEERYGGPQYAGKNLMDLESACKRTHVPGHLYADEQANWTEVDELLARYDWANDGSVIRLGMPFSLHV
jgi:hypothetical protein